MDKVNALLYPYDVSCFHIVEYCSKFTKYRITGAVSPEGWGYAGKDAGDKLGIVSGITVSSQFDLALENCDAVIFAGSILELDQNHMEEKEQYAKSKNKEVINLCSNNLEERNSVMRAGHADRYSEEQKIYKINKPIVLVFGTGEQTMKFDVQLLIRDCLHAQGYQVTQIGTKRNCEFYDFHSFPDFMFADDLAMEDKIIRFNHYVRALSIEENGDIIVIGVPGGIAPYSDEYHNHFGKWNYMVANAIRPDYVVLNSIFVDYMQEYLDTLKQSLRWKYEYEVDAVFVSNCYLNWAATTDLDQLVFTTLPNCFLENEIKDTEAFGVYSKTGREAFTRHLLETLTGYYELAAF